MKLLMVSPNLPCPAWGASTRNYHLLKALARKHTVSLLALVDRNEDVECNISQLKDFTSTVHIIARSASHPKRLQQVMCVVRGKSYILESNSLVEMQEALDRLRWVRLRSNSPAAILSIYGALVHWSSEPGQHSCSAPFQLA